jgi:DNA-binding NarL/FixJ family response regulator
MVRESVVRILVVEDDPAWQQILREILTDDGAEVDVAHDVASAVACLRRQPHRLAVVDLALGAGEAANMDGLEVLDAVRRHDPGCVTILLTGYATVELAVDVLQTYGAFSCLRKANFDRVAFRQVVRRALSSAPPYEAVAPSGSAGTVPSPGEGGVGEDAAGLLSVLVVEDDAGWRSILAELLSDEGYQVRLCNSYGEAVGCLRRDTYHIAIVDLSLSGPAWDAACEPEPELDGYQLLGMAQAEGIPTIVVSGVARQEGIERAYGEYDLFAYLEKQSFDRRAFLQTVTEARQAGEASRELDALTPRETEALALLAQGMTNKEIAEALVISTNTVKRHLKAIFDKLDVHNRAAAVAKAVNAGIPLEDIAPD